MFQVRLGLARQSVDGGQMSARLPVEHATMGRCLQGFLWSMQLYSISGRTQDRVAKRGERESLCEEGGGRAQTTGDRLCPRIDKRTVAPGLLCSTRNPIRVVVDALLPCLHLISIHSTQRLRPYRMWGGRPGRHYVTLFTYPATNSVSSFGECSFRARLWFISMKS